MKPTGSMTKTYVCVSGRFSRRDQCARTPAAHHPHQTAPTARSPASLSQSRIPVCKKTSALSQHKGRVHESRDWLVLMCSEVCVGGGELAVEASSSRRGRGWEFFHDGNTIMIPLATPFSKCESLPRWHTQTNRPEIRTLEKRTTSSVIVYATGGLVSPTLWWVTLPARKTPFSLKTQAARFMARSLFPDSGKLKEKQTAVYTNKTTSMLPGH